MVLGDEREVNLLRPSHHDLRIRWSAQVNEQGGEFLISRQGIGGPTSVVARVQPRSQGRYQVAQPGAAGFWLYKIRYRDRRGREHELATIRVNVESLDDTGRGVMSTGASAQPPAIQAAMLFPQPAATAALPAVAPAAAARGPDRFPPTPPP
jgi:hypothetical protein